jgi:hypothetical protein
MLDFLKNSSIVTKMPQNNGAALCLIHRHQPIFFASPLPFRGLDPNSSDLGPQRLGMLLANLLSCELANSL